jgi:hypothetical protein
MTDIACYDSKEGCLDVKAVNFDPTADRNCCCEYPRLVLTTLHAWGTGLMTYQVPLAIPVGDSIVIRSLRWYASDISMSTAAGRISIIEADNLPQRNSGKLEVKKNIALVDRNELNYPLSTYTASGTTNLLQFMIGLPAGYNNLIIDSISSHPLARQSDTMYDDASNRYLHTKIVFEAVKTKKLYSLTWTSSEAQLPISLAYNKVIEAGENLPLPIRIDYKRWWTGVTLDMQPNQMVSRIRSNIAGSISISQ